MEELDFIAKNVWEKKVDAEKAAFDVLTFVAKNRAYFHLLSLDYDALHDFLLEEYPHTISILKRFSPERGNFTCFYYMSLKAALQVYLRKSKKHIAEADSLGSVQELLYEEQDYNYEQDQPDLAVEAMCDTEQLRQITQNQLALKHQLMANTMKKKYFHINEQKNVHELRKMACLILFLKSCFFTDDKTLKKVSLLTGIDEEELFAMVEKLKKCLTKKIGRKEVCLKARDNAFFFHRRYRVERDNLDKNDNMYSKVRRCYEIQTEKWIANNKKLKTLSPIEPSNRDIGNILNISERKVAYILLAAEKNIDSLILREDAV